MEIMSQNTPQLRQIIGSESKNGEICFHFFLTGIFVHNEHALRKLLTLFCSAQVMYSYKVVEENHYKARMFMKIIISAPVLQE